MEREEDTVRVWVGRDPLQAKLMEQMLLDNGVECFSSGDRAMELMGSRGDIGLWVARKDESRARALLEEMEEEMSAALDADDDTAETDS